MQFVQKLVSPYTIGTAIVATGIVALLHMTEHVHQDLLNKDQLTPLIVAPPHSSTASIWYTRHHFQTKFLKLIPLALSTNMYLIQLPNSNDFIIYNPSKLTPFIKLHLLQLFQERGGELKFIVVGSQAHTMFFEEYLENFGSTKVIVPMNKAGYFAKQLSNKKLAGRIFECNPESQTGRISVDAFSYPSVVLYHLFGTEATASEVVLLEKSTRSMFVTDSVQNFDSQQTMVRKPDQESFLSKIYSRVCRVRNQFAAHGLISRAVMKPDRLRQVLHSMQQEFPLVENMFVGHGVPIVHSPQNMMQEFLNVWRYYISK